MTDERTHEGQEEPGDLDLPPRTLIAERFRVVRVIGRGGHGVVYEAEHVALGYPVAIKVLHAAYGLDARRRARFQREALVGASLRHRNVAAIHDAGELDDGSPFLVMEHVDGIDLATLIARVRLDAAAAIEVGVQLLAALAALYDRGVIHRDVKPNNVMLKRSVDGYVELKLLDFGISKALRAEVTQKTLTADDCVLGTPQYMSPEQVRGEPLDVRTDLYSVGALLYECLTGAPPFDAETAGAVLARILVEDARPVRTVRADVPIALAEVVDRAVRKRAADRWGTPKEMSEALRAIAQRLGLPRGADAWSVLTTEPREGSSSCSTEEEARRSPEVAVPVPPPPPRAAETAPERPRTKSGRHPDGPSLPWTRGSGRGSLSWLSIGIAIGAPFLAIALATAGAVTFAGTARSPEAASPPRTSAPAKVLDDAPQSRSVTATAASTSAPSNGGTATTGAGAIDAPVLPIPRTARAGAPLDPAELELGAIAAYLAGRDAEAISVYTRATEIAPFRASAWRGLGLAAASSGDRDTARRALHRYLELAPRAPDRGEIEQRIARLGG